MSNVYRVAYTGITYAAVHNLYGSLFPVEYGDVIQQRDGGIISGVHNHNGLLCT